MTMMSDKPYFRGWIVDSIDCTDDALFLQVWNKSRTLMTRMSLAQAKREANRLGRSAAGDELRDAVRAAQRWTLSQPRSVSH